MDAGTGTVALFAISLFMIVIALVLLILAIKKGYFNRINQDAYIPFNQEDQPVGEPTDQLFAEENQEK